MKAFPNVKQALIIFFVIGIGAYFNILFNGFVFDDKEQIVKPFIIHDLKYIPLLFVTSVHYQSVFSITDYYYKPMMYVLFSVFYFLGGGKPLLFHFSQLFIHIINSLLVFYLFRKFLYKKLAIFLGILFLLHPANQSTVAYISSLQDVLFLFFGMLSVVLAFGRKNLSFLQLFIINILLFLSLLSKETGILFVAIVTVLFFLEKIKNLRKAVFFILATTSFYLILRLISYNYFFLYLNSSHLKDLSLIERLNNAIGIFLIYAREMILPLNGILPHFLPTRILTDFMTLFIFLLTTIIVISFLFLVGRKLKKADKKDYVYFWFFAVWFILGILFHMQLISLDVSIASRWLYFPLIGFLAILGFSFKAINSLRLKYLIAILGSLIIVLFFFQVVQMNGYWINEETLTAHTLSPGEF